MSCSTSFWFRGNCSGGVNKCKHCKDNYCKYHCKPTGSVAQMVGGHNCSGYTPGAAIGNAFTAVTEKATVAAGGSGFMDRNNIDAMNAVHDAIGRSGVKSQYDGVATLKDLVTMANDVYDLHGSTRISKSPPRGWVIHDQIQQPNYGGGYPDNLAMAVYVKDQVAVVVFKGTDPGSASDAHADVTGVVRGEAPAKPLMAALRLVKKWQDKGFNVMVTGHSLGGYMAEVTATHIGLAGVGFCVPATGWHAGEKGRKGTFINICEKSDMVVGGGQVVVGWADRKMKTQSTNHGNGHAIEKMMSYLNGNSLGNSTNRM